MSRYAWANPTDGTREQDDDLSRAIGRIQADLKKEGNRDLHSVVLYEQEPRAEIQRTRAVFLARKRRTRFLDWLRIRFRPWKAEQVEIAGTEDSGSPDSQADHKGAE